MRHKKPWLEFVNRINELQKTTAEPSASKTDKSQPLFVFYNGVDDVTVLRKKLNKG